MKTKSAIWIISGALLLIFTGSAEARLKRYTYSYDIAEIEWQFLNWTAAWRGTTTPADPFTLERMVYDRETKKANVYLEGKESDATQANLDKSVNETISLFSKRFTPEFDADTDLVVHYQLKSGESKKITYIKYEDGAFSAKKSLDPGSIPDSNIGTIY